MEWSEALMVVDLVAFMLYIFSLFSIYSDSRQKYFKEIWAIYLAGAFVWLFGIFSYLLDAKFGDVTVPILLSAYFIIQAYATFITNKRLKMLGAL